MDNTFEIVLHFMLIALIAGVLGSSVMIGLMRLFGQVGDGQVPMITALGSLFTGSYERAREVGIYVHFVNGVIFAVLYALALLFLGMGRPDVLLLFGGVFGFLHGMVVAIALVVMIAERHPLKEFQNVSFRIAAAHVVGHIGYGLVVSSVVAASGMVPDLANTGLN